MSVDDNVFQRQHQKLQEIGVKINQVEHISRLATHPLERYNDNSFAEEFREIKLVYNYFLNPQKSIKEDILCGYIIGELYDYLCPKSLQSRYNETFLTCVPIHTFQQKLSYIAQKVLLNDTMYKLPITAIDQTLRHVLDWLNMFVGEYQTTECDTLTSSIFLDQHNVLSEIGKTLPKIKQICRLPHRLLDTQKLEEVIFIYNYFQNNISPHTDREKEIIYTNIINKYVQAFITTNIDHLIPTIIITNTLSDLLQWCTHAKDICNKFITTLNQTLMRSCQHGPEYEEVTTFAENLEMTQNNTCINCGEQNNTCINCGGIL